MSEEYKKKMGIPQNHTLKQTSSEWKAKKGQDTDTYHYDHLDESGNLVGKYIVYDSTSMYPPFGRTIDWEKVS
ncbi:hypothetical protein D8T51_21780 [Vibrio vulnificus]|uniref:hypothetical protein n=1 Tax=Vibrio TaxID=662 RepID=UPI00084BAFEA|nr:MULTISPECIES: hypothetical protein [Vibrio]EHP3507973.1 hypothetical protein [Vibrio cholerae]EGQ7955972.1 hypothetical protein [Vibrio vulnificus]EGQ9237897.1 hypothetical protein [Vibrio vulnificus]EGR0637716.1 hypothetical protein [Vibrio vulnificus]EGR7962020.1 hypothetical protein [Vibrio vulnificus]